MQVAYVGKRLLGESDAPAMATQVGGELLSYGFHRTTLSLAADGRSTDESRRAVSGLALLLCAAGLVWNLLWPGQS